METLTIKNINNIIKEYLKGENQSSFDINEEIALVGWIRTNRDSGRILFISFTDGSRLNSLQIVCKENSTEGYEEIRNARTGAAIRVIGKIIVTENAQQKFEIQANKIILLKQSDESYPIQKKEHSLETLRDNAHLRIRTNRFYSIMKLRSELSFAVHNFFHLNDFVWVSSPIITSSDSEGAGESFSVESKSERNFFGNSKAFLTVSGQLHAEAYAQSFKRVYTFGPTFRADKSHTNRHLAEFWMIEPEIAFCNLDQLIYLTETFIKFVIKTVLKKCTEEIDFFQKLKNDKRTSEGKTPIDIKNSLESIIEGEFVKVDYREVINILKKDVAKGKIKFDDSNIHFGMDLKTEHERYICEVIYSQPVFVKNYPKDLKPFYMKLNDDGETVAAMDLLIPGIGELVGGSQREDDYQKIAQRCSNQGINQNEMEWYLELRKYGYWRSSGFGLGFERLVMFIADLENIKDAIPFPRNHAQLKF